MEIDDKLTRDNIGKYYEPVEMVGGYSFSHHETIKKIHMYYLGKFLTGQYNGRQRKFFYNITKPSVDVAAKFLDIDLANFVFVPESEGGDEGSLAIFIAQKDFRYWAKRQGFSLFLNNLVDNYAKGWAVFRLLRGKPVVVSPFNLRADPSAPNLLASPFIYELYILNRSEITRMKGVWDNTDELLDRMGNEKQVVVYECYDMTDKGWVRTIKGDLRRRKNGRNEPIEASINTQDQFLPSVVLDIREVERPPYYEARFEDVDGRLLPYGIPEALFENQIAINEAENLERQGLALTSLKLWQTRDDSIGGSNVLDNDVRNGDILTVDQEISPIPMEERNLAAFNATRARWDENTQQISFSYDIARGDNLPSRTPVGVANISANMVSSYFEKKRENLAIALKDFVYEAVFPQFKRENMKSHIVSFAGNEEDVEVLDRFIIETKVDEAVVKRAKQTGFFPSSEARNDLRERIKRKLRSQRNRLVKVPDLFYDNIKAYIDILIVGESRDVAKQNEAMNFAMQLLSTNPGILQNEVTRSIFFALLQGNGISPVTLSMLKEQVDTDPTATDKLQELLRGGSISAKGAQTAPATGKAETTL